MVMGKATVWNCEDNSLTLRRFGQRLAIGRGAILAVALVYAAISYEQMLDAIHAWRTGYHFVWMPEGVIPNQERALNAEPMARRGFVARP